MSFFVRFSAVFILMGFCDLFTTIARVFSAGSPDLRSLIYSALWATAYGLSIISLLRAPNPRITFNMVIAIAFGLYVFLSLQWSHVSSRPYDLAIAFIATIFVSIMFAKLIDETWLFRTLQLIIVSACSISILLYVAGVPFAIYIDGLDRSNLLGLVPMSGVFSHKVVCALLSSIGAIISISRSGRVTFADLSSFLVCVISAILSGSASGALLLFVGIVIVIVARLGLLINSVFARFSVLLLCLIGGFAATILQSFVLESLGRDAGMTGRRSIWDATWKLTEVHPLVGWGYQSIITRNADGPFFDYYKVIYYTPSHVQNSYLQILAELGYVGVLFIAIVLIAGIMRQITRISRIQSNRALSGFAVLVVISLDAYAENLFLGNSFGLFFAVWCFIQERRSFQGEADTAAP